MIVRAILLATVLPVLASCAAWVPLKASPHSDFELMVTQESRPPVLPEGVAVLRDTPACAFTVLGEARTTHHVVNITPSRIRALREQAAMHGADAIIVHPNRHICADGTQTPICPGRGEYVIASAIQYLDEPSAADHQVGLEYEFKRGYDTVEFYNHR